MFHYESITYQPLISATDMMIDSMTNFITKLLANDPSYSQYMREWDSFKGVLKNQPFDKSKVDNYLIQMNQYKVLPIQYDNTFSRNNSQLTYDTVHGINGYLNGETHSMTPKVTENSEIPKALSGTYYNYDAGSNTWKQEHAVEYVGQKTGLTSRAESHVYGQNYTYTTNNNVESQLPIITQSESRIFTQNYNNTSIVGHNATSQGVEIEYVNNSGYMNTTNAYVGTSNGYIGSNNSYYATETVSQYAKKPYVGNLIAQVSNLKNTLSRNTNELNNMAMTDAKEARTPLRKIAIFPKERKYQDVYGEINKQISQMPSYGVEEYRIHI